MTGFDPALLLDLRPVEVRDRITPAKVMLYGLGVGATELPFVYEGGLQALPTMVVTMGYPGFVWRDPGLKIDRRRVLHAETGFTLHAPIPITGELISRTTFGPIFDKGADRGAVVCQTRSVHHEDGTLIATVRDTNFLRGDGGFGGSPEGQPAPRSIPDRAPDLVRALTSASNQALIYRLSGDMNPLHADPTAAIAAGFDRPILHGLCTFGIAGRALIAGLCDNDPARVVRMDVRFSKPVYPGETIITEIWRESAGISAFRCRVAERDVIVLNHGLFEYR